jgi:predicted nucleotidyltransferase
MLWSFAEVLVVPRSDLAQLIVDASDVCSPSQALLAEEIGVRPLALTTWRTGRSRPTRAHLLKMAEVLARRGERLIAMAAALEERAKRESDPAATGRDNRDRSSAERLAAAMAAAGDGRVLQVIFYGSRARGAPRSSASDWDFVVILRGDEPKAESSEDRLREAAAAAGDENVDVWPISQRDWERNRTLPGHPLRAAASEGIVVYDAG